MTTPVTFRAYGDVGGDIMRALDTEPGWEYRGSHGVFCAGNGDELYGYAYGGPNGEHVTLDFTRNERKGSKVCVVGGLPDAIRERVA